MLEPTTKLPTSVVEPAAGNVCAALKLTPLGKNETFPAVDIDVGTVAESTSRPVDEIIRSPPTAPATERWVNIRPVLPSPIWLEPELISTRPSLVSVVTAANVAPTELALEVSPVISMPALLPDALSTKKSVAAVVEPRDSPFSAADVDEMVIAGVCEEKFAVASMMLETPVVASRILTPPLPEVAAELLVSPTIDTVPALKSTPGTKRTPADAPPSEEPFMDRSPLPARTTKLVDADI